MKTKITVWLIILLVVLNLASIFVFWLGRINIPGRPVHGTPKDYIIKQLGFDAKQQKQYSELVTLHRQASEKYQDSIRIVKDAFFNLLKDASVTETAKRTAAAAVSKQNEKLDLLTFAHFQKVRMICTEDQKKKFDKIIHQVLYMMGRPKPPDNGPPPNGTNLKDRPEMNGPHPNGPRRNDRLHPYGPPPGGPEGRNGPPPYGPPDGNGPPPPGRDGMPPPPPQ